MQRLTPGILQICCRAALPISAAAPQKEPGISTQGFSAQRERESRKLFPYERLGLAIHLCFCSFPIFQLQYSYGGTEHFFFFFFFLVSHWESFKQLVSFFNLQARILKIYGLFKGIKEEVSWYKPIKLH